MADKKFLLSAVIFVFSIFTVFTQDLADEPERDFDDSEYMPIVNINNEKKSPQPDPECYLVEDENGFRFFQKLKWDDSGIVSHYTIKIEKEIPKSRGKYEPVVEEETKNTELEVSLESGNYRYKIFVYNVLDQLEIETEWMPFVIQTAYQPEIKDVSPFIVYLEEEPDGKYTINGRYITKDADIKIHKTGKGDSFYPEKTEISDKGNRAKISFNMKQIDTGKYQIEITNPGGLKIRSNDFIIKFKKPVDFNISAGYALHAVLFDDTFEQYLGHTAYPIGLAAKMSLIPIKKRFGYFGIGAIASATTIKQEFDGYSISGNILNINGNLIYQKPLLKRRIMLEAFAGAGVVYFADFKYQFPHNYVSPPLNSLNFTADAGISAQFYITKRLFVDTTVQFIYGFTKDMDFAMVVPQALIGWQF